MKTHMNKHITTIAIAIAWGMTLINVQALDASSPIPTGKKPTAAVQEAEAPAPATVAVEAPSRAPTESEVELSDDGDDGELEVTVGTRILYIELLSDKKGEPFKGSFVGSINRIEADQDYAPLHPYIQVMWPLESTQLGVGASYDKLEVITRDSGGGDGTIQSDAFNLYVILAMSPGKTFTPFAEIGVSLYDNTFDPLPDWAAGGLRRFDLDNSVAPYVAAGCSVALADDWSLNVYARYIDVDVDGKYIFKGDNRDPESFTFTLEHVAVGAGIAYEF